MMDQRPVLDKALDALMQVGTSEWLHALQSEDFELYLELCALTVLAEALQRRLRKNDQ